MGAVADPHTDARRRGAVDARARRRSSSRGSRRPANRHARAAARRCARAGAKTSNVPASANVRCIDASYTRRSPSSLHAGAARSPSEATQPQSSVRDSAAGVGHARCGARGVVLGAVSDAALVQASCVRHRGSSARRRRERSEVASHLQHVAVHDHYAGTSSETRLHDAPAQLTSCLPPPRAGAVYAQSCVFLAASRLAVRQQRAHERRSELASHTRLWSDRYRSDVPHPPPSQPHRWHWQPFLTASITHRLEQFEGRMDQHESNDV